MLAWVLSLRNAGVHPNRSEGEPVDLTRCRSRRALWRQGCFRLANARSDSLLPIQMRHGRILGRFEIFERALRRVEPLQAEAPDSELRQNRRPLCRVGLNQLVVFLERTVKVLQLFGCAANLQPLRSGKRLA